MATRSLLAALAFVLVGTAADTAAANPCRWVYGGIRQGPVEVGFGPASFGQPRRACPRSEAVVGVTGFGVYEPEKYGLDPTTHVAAGAPLEVGGAVKLEASARLGRRLELFGTFEPVSGRYLISAYQASQVGLGHTSAGMMLNVYDTGPIALTVVGRTTLPTAVGLYRNAWPVGLDTGLSMILQPLPFLQLHGYVGGAGSIALTAGNPNPRAGLVGAGGVQVLFWHWLSFVADLQSMALYDADVDHISAAFAVRGKVFRGLALEWATIVPLAGAERTLASTGLQASFRFF